MYSTETQAKNGFKTFMVTLVISLVLFGSLYYLLTGFSEEIDIESDAMSLETSTTTESNEEPAKEVAFDKSAVQGTTTSVFQEIEKKPVTAKPAYVLAGSTSEASESSVPSTGSETVFGIALATFSFAAAIFVIAFGPRKIALSEFEKEMSSL